MSQPIDLVDPFAPDAPLKASGVSRLSEDSASADAAKQKTHRHFMQFFDASGNHANPCNNTDGIVVKSLTEARDEFKAWVAAVDRLSDPRNASAVLFLNADVISNAQQILAQRCSPGAEMISPGNVISFLRLKLGGLGYEVFGAVYLDSRHRVIELKEEFRGTIDGCAVHPREIARQALTLNAAAVILYHNHPSGCCTPSQADRNITQRLHEALGLFEIRTLDHFIVSASGYSSMAEAGLI